MKIQFLGAAETVTGSCYLVTTNGLKFLVDCGMFQGIDVEHKNHENFKFMAEEIDFVLLTHAHMDHSGLLPKLYKNGFRGPVYMTPQTAELAEILLLDSARVQEKNYLDQKRGHQEAPLYDTKDSLGIINQFRTYKIGFWQKIADGVQVFMLRAGHILGAVSIVLEINGKVIVFSGDIGRVDQSVIKGFDQDLPEELVKVVSKNGGVHTIIMESLYGGERHPSRADAMNKLTTIIEQKISRNANVIIPSFAVHRTQEILLILKNALKISKIKQNVQIFLDSPLASKATKIYTDNFRELKRVDDYNHSVLANTVEPEHGNVKATIGITKHDKNHFLFDQLRIINQYRQSLAIKKSPGSVVIAGSGMADGGRVLNHLVSNIESSSNAVVFVGYQAEGTLGRQLVDGAKDIIINKSNFKVRAEIDYIHGLSAHADTKDLETWLKRFQLQNNAVIYLVHSEIERSRALQQQLAGYQVHIPSLYEEVEISSGI